MEDSLGSGGLRESAGPSLNQRSRALLEPCGRRFELSTVQRPSNELFRAASGCTASAPGGSRLSWVSREPW